MEVNIWQTLVSFCFGVFVTSFVSLGVKPYVERLYRRRDERDAFRALTNDVVRHVVLSLAALYVIEKEMRKHKITQNYIFRYSHLKKMSLMDKSGVFDEQLYINAPPELVGDIQHLRLRIRNLELDFEEAKLVYIRGDWDSIYDCLTRLIEQLKKAKDEKFYDSLKRIQPCYDFHRARYEKILETKRNKPSSQFIRYEARLMSVLYDKQWWTLPKSSDGA